MADNHSKEVRRMNMSHIRSTNSKPEEIVRKYLFSKGFRYRKNVRKLPGCPDIVLPKYRTVIFVNGCFWHRHDCPRFVWPSSNQDYEVPRSHQVKDRADDIKEEGLWQEVRDKYLEKKNMYLSWQDHNHPSFVVYVEAVNEVYNRYFNRGGGYNVQSIF